MTGSTDGELRAQACRILASMREATSDCLAVTSYPPRASTCSPSSTSPSASIARCTPGACAWPRRCRRRPRIARSVNWSGMASSSAAAARARKMEPSEAADSAITAMYASASRRKAGRKLAGYLTDSSASGAVLARATGSTGRHRAQPLPGACMPPARRQR